MAVAAKHKETVIAGSVVTLLLTWALGSLDRQLQRQDEAIRNQSAVITALSENLREHQILDAQLLRSICLNTSTTENQRAGCTFAR